VEEHDFYQVSFLLAMGFSQGLIKKFFVD